MANLQHDSRLKTMFHRSALIFGEKGIEKFQNSSAAVVGLGGVGSFAAEMLIRNGIGTLTIIDFDRVNVTNLNRQLPALTSTIGEYKSIVLKQRLEDINPAATIIAHTEFCGLENRSEMLKDVDFIVDAIDSLGPKVGLLQYAHQSGKKVISCMGAANRVDPSMIRLSDIEQVQGCPLAARVRRYLRKLGVSKGIPVVHSCEEPLPLKGIEMKPEKEPTLKKGRERLPLGSTSYLPAIIGAWAASYVLRNIAWEYSLYEDG